MRISNVIYELNVIRKLNQLTFLANKYKQDTIAINMKFPIPILYLAIVYQSTQILLASEIIFCGFISISKHKQIHQYSCMLLQIKDSRRIRKIAPIEI